MNKTVLAFALIALAAGVCCSAENGVGNTSKSDADGKVRMSGERAKKHREAIYRATGGRLVKPNSMKGKIRIVLAAKDVTREGILQQYTSFGRMGKFDFEIVNGDAVTVDTAMKSKSDINADLAVFVVEGKGTAPMIAAPEEGWAIVNATACGSASRTEKEVVRAFAYIGGAATSTYDKSVMSVVKPAELDMVSELEIPFDVVDRMLKYLKTRGITSEIRTTYKVACEEGWAQKPTNDVQRAIWDKVYALPDKPIKIKFDAKRDAGK